MFKALPSGSTLAVDRRHVTTLVCSTNAVKIVYGAGPMRMARAYVFALELPGGVAQVYAYLGLVERGPHGELQGLLFGNEQHEVVGESSAELLREAVKLVQQQGFKLERVDLGAMSDDARAQATRDLPFENALPFRVGDRAPVGGVIAEATARAEFGTGAYALPVEASRAVGLPGHATVQAVGRILSLF